MWVGVKEKPSSTSWIIKNFPDQTKWHLQWHIGITSEDKQLQYTILRHYILSSKLHSGTEDSNHFVHIFWTETIDTLFRKTVSLVKILKDQPDSVHSTIFCGKRSRQSWLAVVVQLILLEDVGPTSRKLSRIYQANKYSSSIVIVEDVLREANIRSRITNLETESGSSHYFKKNPPLTW